MKEDKMKPTYFIGPELKRFRKMFGLTLQQVADKTESSKSYIWELENKQIEPSGYKVVRLAEIFGVPCGAFYGRVHSGPNLYDKFMLTMTEVYEDLAKEIQEENTRKGGEDDNT